MDELKLEISGRTLRTDPVGSWWLTGLEGWFDAPSTRVDEDLIPGGDGAFDANLILLEPRRLVVRGFCEAASSGWVEREVRPWLAALSKSQDLGLRVFSDQRWLSVRNSKVRGSLKVRAVEPTMTEFEIPVWSHDPRKYGPTRQIEIDAVAEPVGGMRFPIVDGALDFAMEGLTAFPGVFKIENPGTAEFFPERFTVKGPLDGFTITSEQSTVQYDGPVGIGDELVLTPYAGGRATLNGADVSHNLIRAEWVAVQPGETRGFLFSPIDPLPGSKLTIDHPEGAWL